MNNINTLREHLFETLKGVKDGTIDLEKAKCMGEISQVIVNTAKIEVDYLRANGGGKADFMNVDPNKQITQTPMGIKTVNGASTVHQIK
ncbi:MAG: hypothetical protein V4605_04965 [Pseudomonadota bacterium]